MVKIRDIMKKPVITVDKDASISEVAKLMKEHKIGSVVVLDKEKIAGIVTETDIIYKVVAENKDLNAKVSEIMSRDVKTANEDEDIEHAAKIMAAHRIRRLPVVKGEKLIGIITLRDIVKAEAVNKGGEYYPYFT